MSLLMHPAQSTTRNKTGVANLIKTKAPVGQLTLEYWLAWLRANW